MIQEIANYMISGKPLFFWLGGVVMTFLLATFITGLLVIRGKVKFKHHKMLAFTLICIGIVHGILAMSVYIGF